ncbi:hypothetical protein LQF12_11120 [Ruania suaedae]|uniref:hypothetical protein n=1 Tax=Ruania suaedae TaxID=2897774 RepID=UPI001E2F0A95|nr:hypothetical protein [Ruania suaedae]UFU02061.1 hypothetical protein LQF12_11120 [Ruania suaedae]
MRGTSHGRRRSRTGALVPAAVLGAVALGLAGCTDPSPGWDGVWDFSAGATVEPPEIDGLRVTVEGAEPDTVREVGSAGELTAYSYRKQDRLCVTLSSAPAKMSSSWCGEPEPFADRGTTLQMRGQEHAFAMYVVPLGYDLSELDRWPGIDVLTDQIAVQDLTETRTSDQDVPDSILLEGPRGAEIELPVEDG